MSFHEVPDPLAPRLSVADRARLAALMAAERGAARIVWLLAGEAAAATDVPVLDILGRDRRFSGIRHVVIHAAHEAGLDFSEIARAMGIDHASVRYAVRRETAKRRGGQ